MSMRRQMLGTVKTVFQYAAPRAAVRYRIRKHAHLEPELELLDDLIDSSREAIDVGANLGVYAVRLVQMAQAVHLIEPHPRLARALTATFGDRAAVYHAAASDVPGRVPLRVPVVDGYTDEGRASLEDAAGSIQFRTFEVRALTLDEFADRNVGFVKIDVEGHESRVLAGARALVERQRPVLLVEAEECHRRNAVADVVEYFRDLDYQGVFVHGSEVREICDFRAEMQDPESMGRPDSVYVNNFVFIPQEQWTNDRHAHLNRLAASGASSR